jgi:uncharacterized protein (TIGR00251 family)
VGVRITVRVTPRAGRDEIQAAAGGVLAVRVTAAPDEGKANLAVCRLVADALGVPKTSVSVVRGHASRVKTLEVVGVDATDVERLLAR